MDAVPFGCEQQLHDALVECPALVLVDGETVMQVVGSKVKLDGDEADIVLLDGDMLLTVVEVKLQTNGDARRTIVGQVFDYVSSLAQMSFDQLDEQVDGALTKAVEKLSADADNEIAFEESRKKCGAFLKAGNIRVAIVVDEAPNKLIRIMQYLSDQSNLDIRLVRIKQYINEEDQKMYVPEILVCSASGKTLLPAMNQTNEKLIAAVEKFEDKLGDQGRVVGTGSTYRQVQILDWPRLVHYEFMHSKRNSTLSAELHVEDAKQKRLTDALPGIAQSIKSGFGSNNVVYDSSWSNGKGRIRLVFPDDVEPSAVSDAMAELIQATKEKVSGILDFPHR